jgi:two-component system, LytTR family, response regulator
MQIKKLKSIIVEDELLSSQLLENLIKEFVPEVDVHEIVTNIPQAIESIRKNVPDIIFLDVDLNGTNSFTILDRFPTGNFKVIITSGHEQYALDAFKYNVTDYLLKPYGIEQLILAIEKVKRLLSLSQNEPTNSFGSIVISGADGRDFIRMEDIIRIEADGMYCHIYMVNAQKKIVAKPLKAIEEYLHDKIFMRVHHSHVINIHQLERYMKDGNGSLLMKDGSIVPVSKRKKKELMQWIDEL